MGLLDTYRAKNPGIDVKSASNLEWTLETLDRETKTLRKSKETIWISNLDNEQAPVLLAGSKFRVNDDFVEIQEDTEIGNYSDIELDSAYYYVFVRSMDGLVEVFYNYDDVYWDAVRQGYYSKNGPFGRAIARFFHAYSILGGEPV